MPRRQGCDTLCITDVSDPKRKDPSKGQEFSSWEWQKYHKQSNQVTSR